MNDIIISGSSNLDLATSIARLNKIGLADVEIGYFTNKEKRIRILSDLKDKNVYLVQSTSLSPDEHLMETLLLADAAKRLGPKRIHLFIPWLSYSPQDKIFRNGESLSSHVIIDIFNNSPIDEFHILDIHSTIILEKFKKPVDHMTAMPLFVKYFKDKLKKGSEKLSSVSVDKGDLQKSEEFAKCLGCNLVKFEKFRNKDDGSITFTNFYGSVKGKDLVVFDDYVSTGTTLLKSAQYLKQKGAKSYCFCVTHITSAESLAKIIVDPAIDYIITTNSIPFSFRSPKLIVMDAAELYKIK